MSFIKARINEIRGYRPETGEENGRKKRKVLP